MINLAMRRQQGWSGINTLFEGSIVLCWHYVVGGMQAGQIVLSPGSIRHKDSIGKRAGIYPCELGKS